MTSIIKNTCTDTREGDYPRLPAIGYLIASHRAGYVDREISSLHKHVMIIEHYMLYKGHRNRWLNNANNVMIQLYSMQDDSLDDISKAGGEVICEPHPSVFAIYRQSRG